jgi:hypothetical protein
MPNSVLLRDYYFEQQESQESIEEVVIEVEE